MKKKKRAVIIIEVTKKYSQRPRDFKRAGEKMLGNKATLAGNTVFDSSVDVDVLFQVLLENPENKDVRILMWSCGKTTERNESDLKQTDLTVARKLFNLNRVARATTGKNLFTCSLKDKVTGIVPEEIMTALGAAAEMWINEHILSDEIESDSYGDYGRLVAIG